MAKIGALNIRLGADIRPLKTDLTAAKKISSIYVNDTNSLFAKSKFGDSSKLFGSSSGAIQGGLKTAISRINPLIAGLGMAGDALKKLGVIGVASGTAIAYGLKTGMDAVDELSDASKKLFNNGGGTGALAGLQLAAQDAGLELAAVTTGVEKMLDTISKASRGDKGSVEALRAIGLTARELIAMRPEDRLLAVADGLGAIRDAGDKISLARGIFGKAGGGLVPLFNEGSGAIRAATIEARFFGQALSAVDAEQVGAAGDALNRVGQTFKGGLMQSALEFAPLIEKGANKLVDMIGGANGVGAAVDNAFTFGVEKVGGFLDLLDRMDTKLLEIRITTNSLFGKLARGVETVTEKIGEKGAVEERELQRRAQMVPEHRREEFIRRAREAGGFKSERAAEYYGEAEAETTGEMKDKLKGKQSRKGLGSRFKEYIYNAQNTALERAQNKLLGNEQSITEELEDQADLRKAQARSQQEAGQGRLALTAFNGPVALSDRMGRLADTGAASVAPGKLTTSSLSEAGPEGRITNDATEPTGESPAYLKKIPGSAPRYLDKIPQGDPKYMSKMPDSTAMADRSTDHISRRENAANSEAPKQTRLLTQLVENTRGGAVTKWA